MVWFQRKMVGRYGGNDILNKHLFYLFITLWLVFTFILKRPLYSGVVLGVLIGLIYFRTFSKNANKRYRENYRYTQWLKKVKQYFKRIKDLPKYKYLKCVHCKKEMRVPRGKGDIVVTCPSCKQKFDAKS